MSVNPARISEQPSEDQRPTMVEMIERLSRFDGPPEQFLVNLLAVQCHLAAADGGAILRINPSQQVEILAVYPQPAPGSTAPVWLAQSAEFAPTVVTGGKTAIRPLHGADDLYGQPAGRHLVMVPLRGGSGVLGMAAFTVSSNDPQVLGAVQQRLELTVSLLSLYEMRLTLHQRQGDLGRLRLAMETTSAVNEHDRATGAAMAMCNEIASRWGCDRVSLGFLKGRYIHLKATSHTEKFSRKMKLVQDIESAMEETLDQDVEVLYPAPRESTFVCRAAAELSKRHGPSAVLSLPLRRDEEVVAVLTLERPAEETFTLEEAEALRLTCDLATPRLIGLHRQDRWFGARAAATVRKGFATFLGPKHTWIKVAAIGICAAIVFLVFGRTEFRAEAPFVLEATIQQIVPAPFDGYLKRAYVLPGDAVVGTDNQAPTWRLRPGDIPDWPGLLAALRAEAEAGASAPGKRIWAALSGEARRLIIEAGTIDTSRPAEPKGTAAADTDANDGRQAATTGAAIDLAEEVTATVGDPNDAVKAALLGELNDLLASKRLYDADAWQHVERTSRQDDLLKTLAAGRLKGTRLVELNRSLLAAAYPGMIAQGPTVLAELDTDDLLLELKSAEAERHGYLKQKDAALAAAVADKNKRAEALIHQANADRITATIDLLTYRIEQAALVSPIDGYVVSGDLQRQLGAPAKMGDVLFEIASLADLRAELSVPEDLIADVQAAYQKASGSGEPLEGELATAARPDERIPFAVDRIDPVAVVVDQKNVFNVRARLLATPSLFRPGMEGVAKVNIEKRSYGFVYTRKLVNWVRMKLWL